LKEEKIYILPKDKLRIEMIYLYYNVLVVGHKIVEDNRASNKKLLIARSNEEYRKIYG